GAFAREKQENSPSLPAAEFQRATISENGGSDTQNRVSAGNLSHLQLRFLSTLTRKPFKSPVKRTQTIHEIMGLQLAQPAQDERLSSHKKTPHLKSILFRSHRIPERLRLVPPHPTKNLSLSAQERGSAPLIKRNRESTTDIHSSATYTLSSNIYSQHKNGNHSPEGQRKKIVSTTKTPLKTATTQR
ncbi:hypothetical protein PROFUN_16531, partial [Planoprotostelium fungivorum]